MDQGYDFESGGGGIYTTAGDYVKFVQAILNRGVGSNGTRVMEEATVALMCRPDAAPNNTVRMMLSANPEITKDGEFFPGLPKRHSLGFMVNDLMAPTGRSKGSLAWAGIANSYYWIDLTRRIGGVYISQVSSLLV